MCGGTALGVLMTQFRKGLSPRVRGNHNQNAPNIAGQGSIPACAGEPCWSIALAMRT